MNLSSDFIAHVVAGARMADSRLHGFKHWHAVADNGALLAERHGFPRAVTDMFALFHDSRRYNETDDVSHGLRGAFYFDYMLREKYELFSPDFDLLVDMNTGRDYSREVSIACHIHTFCVPVGVGRPLVVNTMSQLLQQWPCDFGLHEDGVYDRESLRVIQSCLDADRLDIGRVGTTVSPQYLFTAEAKRLAMEGGVV